MASFVFEALSQRVSIALVVCFWTWHLWRKFFNVNGLAKQECDQGKVDPYRRAPGFAECVERDLAVVKQTVACTGMEFFKTMILGAFSAVTIEFSLGKSQSGTSLVLCALGVLITHWGSSSDKANLTQNFLLLFYCAFQVVSAAAVFTLWTDDPSLWDGIGLFTLVRCIVSLLVLDWKVTTVGNTFVTVIYIAQHHAANPNSMFAVFELITLIFMQLLCWYVEIFTKGQVEAWLSVRLSSNLQQAMRRLLSVLCDAELRLSSDLRIQDPSLKVGQLLAPGEQWALQGQPFADFVTAADRERILHFLTGPSTAGPAVSLPLKMQDTKGRAFQAELFLARLPEVDGPVLGSGFIIGIKDTENFGDASSRPNVELGCTFGPGRPLPPKAEGESGSGLAQEVWDAVSCSSSSLSAGSCLGAKAVDLPGIERSEIHFDPLDDSMTIKEIRCIFRSAAADAGAGTAATRPGPMPGLCHLKNWFPTRTQEPLVSWVQSNCNDFLGGVNGDFSPSPEKVLLRCPLEAVAVQAAGLTINFESPDDPSDSETSMQEETEGEEAGDTDTDLGVTGILHLKEFKELRLQTQCRQGGRPGSCAGSRQMPPIIEDD